MLVDLAEELDYRACVQVIPWFDWLIRRNPLFRGLRQSTSKFAAHAQAKIADRMKNGKPDERRDLLSHFQEAQKAHPEVVDDTMLVAYLMAPLLAGSDTTAIGLRNVLYYVLRHPRVLDALRAELRDGNVTMPPSWKQAQALPYLDAVIRESMRMHPIVPGVLSRVVPPGPGLQIPDSNIVLPPGTRLSLIHI